MAFISNSKGHIIWNKFQNLYDIVAKKYSVSENMSIELSENISIESPKKNQKILQIQSFVKIEKNENEIEKYRKFETPDIVINSYEWWKQNEKNFSILTQLAKKYLTIQAYSVDIERLWFHAGNIVTEKRNNLSSEHVNQLIYLYENQRFFNK